MAQVGLVVVLAIVTLAGQGKPQKKSVAPATVNMCKPAAPRGPSLMQPDSGGKCQKGYRAMMGKDKKAMYCLNVKPGGPAVECKKVKLPANK